MNEVDQGIGMDVHSRSESQRQDHPVKSEDVQHEELYLFIPSHLRHHFKVDPNAIGTEGDRDAVRDARRTRSASVISILLPQPVSASIPPAPSRPLYSHHVELSLSTRVAYSRAIDRLGEYFSSLTTRLRQLEQASPVLVPSWLDDGGVDGINPTKLPTLLQTQRQVVNTCHGCLSDCDIYLAMHEALPSPPAASPAPLLRFVACSPKSSMLHRVLPYAREENQVSLLPPDNSASGASQRPKYHKPASVSAAAMTTRHPVVIEDIGNYYEYQIVTFASSATPAGPFACFPLVSQRSIERQQPDEEENEASQSIPWVGPPAIGVLSIDACRKAERQRPEAMTVDEVYQFLVYEKQRDTAIELRRLHIDGTRLLLLTENDVMHKPAFQKLKIAARKKLLELIQSLKRGSNRHLQHDNSMPDMPRFFTGDSEALTFLTRVSAMAGVFLDGYRAVHWSREMASVTHDPICSIYDVFEVLVRAVARAISSVQRVSVWKIVPSTHEISAIASTEVPEDRLQPFLRWEERMIKRVALYKELEIPIDADDDGNEASSDGLKLLQGSISKPVFFQSFVSSSNGIPSPSTGSKAPVCESATYNVAWANRTYQSLTWRQLRQLLPIRPMNSKHYQLKILLQQLAATPNVVAPDDRREPLTLSDPNALVLTIRDEFRPHNVVYALEVDFPRDLPPEDVRSSASVAFLQRAVAITERSLLCVHGRTRRRMRRERSIAALTQRFGAATPPNGIPTTGGALMPSRDALRALDDVVAEIFRDITENLPGVDVQVAELQPDGTQLKYTFVGGGSIVEVNKTVLQRGQGVSFRCLDTKTPLVVDPSASPDMYKRLRWLSQQRRQQELDESPFLFIPLVHEDCAVGVLSVDSFHGVPKGRQDESHPERGVVEYLLALGNIVATAIYTKRRSFALYELHQLVLETPLRSPHQLFLGACRALKDVMVGTWKVRLVEVDCTRGKTSLVFDYSEAERKSEKSRLVAAIEPLRLRWKELLPDTVAAYSLPAAVAATSAESSSALQTVDELIASVDKLERENLEQHAELRALIASRRSLGLPVLSSEKQRLQTQRIRDTYFLLLPPSNDGMDTSAALNADTAAKAAMRVSNEKYTTHVLGLFLSTKTFSHALVRSMANPPNVCVFLAVSCLPQFHAECDRAYVNRVAEALARGIETCQARIERSRERVNAVERFRTLCEQEVQRHLQAIRDDISQEDDDGDDEVKSKGKTTGQLGSGQAKRPPHRHRLSPSEELEVEALMTLQHRAIELVQTELNHPDVYIGLLEPSRDRLKYTCASASSAMLGKQLKRGVGVSFDALTKQTPVVITRQDAVDGSDSPVRRLRSYSNKPMKWPFIVVPVGHAGVLALDNLEKYERLAGESQPELGLVDFVRHVATALSDALARVRRATREYRQRLRNQSLLRVMAMCEDRRKRPAAGTITASSPYSPTTLPPTPMFLLHHVMHQLERALNGINAYVGLVDPLCRCIRFVCATSASGMERQSVDATRSVSFHVFATQQTVVVPDLRVHYRSLIDSQRVTTAHRPSAASLARPSARWLKFFGSSELSGAFVCVPIPFVGILSVDTFPGAANGQYLPVTSSPAPPEDGVAEFLEQAGTLIGKSIRAQRADALRATLPTLFRGNRSTFPDLFRSVLGNLSESLPAVMEMHAVRFPKTECCRNYAWPKWKDAAIATLARPQEEGGGGANSASDDAEIAQYFDEYYRTKCSRCNQSSDDEPDSDAVVQLPRRSEIIVVHCVDTRDVSVDVDVGDHDGLEALRHTALVFKRVEGATWTYDADLLRDTLPAINDLIQLGNPRVQGIVRRRIVLRELDRMGEDLEAIHSATEAVSVIREHTLPAAMELIALAMSGHRERENPSCDVYLGERSVFVSGSGGANTHTDEHHPVLQYIAASKRSLMYGVTLDLARPEVQAMVSVQCLEKCTKPSIATATESVTVVHIPQDASTITKQPVASDKKRSLFFGRGHSHTVTPLTLKAAQRAFLVAPMGDNHILCADSLSVEALTPSLASSASTVAHQVETDVVAFFQAAASKLLSTIQSTKWRESFAQLRALRIVPHSNLRAFFAVVLDVLRRDLVRFHSSQVLRLGEDFTRDYDVTAWLGAPTRRDGSHRDGKKKALEADHLCYVSDCTCGLLAKDIHYETQACLPMTNVPRTLDASRSTQQPAEGVEKRGAFATSCLATMLDASVVERSRRAGNLSDGDARWALCVFHHDAVATDETEKRTSDGKRSRRQPRQQWQPVMFTPAQRQYFFALSAVASDVFVDVWRACVLDSSAIELAFVLLEQEELSVVKELVVVRVFNEDPTISCGETASKSNAGSHVQFSTMPSKYTAGSILRKGKLATKLAQFHQPPRTTDLAVFMTRKTVAPSATTATKAVSILPKAPVAPASASPLATTTAAATTKPRGVAALLFGGGRSLFKKRKLDDDGQSVAKPPTPTEVAVQKAATTLTPRQAPPVTLYVLLRAIEQSNARCTDYVLMVLENTTVNAAIFIEAGARRVKQQVDATLAAAGVGSLRFPRGDEECNAKRFCAKPHELLLGDDGGGGGFLLLGMLRRARDQLRDARVPLEAAMRDVLLETHNKPVHLPSSETKTLSTADAADSAAVASMASDQPDGAIDLSALVIATRAAFAATGQGGISRDQLVTMTPVDLCREFLRVKTCDEVLELDPTDRRTWSAIARARALLSSASSLASASKSTVMPSTTTPTTEKVDADTAPPPPSSPTKRIQASRNEGVVALTALLRACFAVVRYLRHLEATMTRTRRETLDAPATVVQCAYRCALARHELKRRRHEFAAALTIQCAFRQHLARRTRLFREWTRAAERVQRAFRSWRARRLHGGRVLAARMKGELRTIAGQLKLAAADNGDDGNHNDDSTWQRDMAGFDSFAAYVASRAGKAQLKREEALLHKRRRAIAAERHATDSDTDSVMWAELGDVFELLDERGEGELSRERVRELMTRVHVPLDVSETEDVVAMMDSDGSGAISLQEFSAWFAHELQGLRRRSRDCGRLSTRDWQWVVRESARGALRKRWRAVRSAAMPPHARAVEESGGEDGERESGESG